MMLPIVRRPLSKLGPIPRIPIPDYIRQVKKKLVTLKVKP